MQIKLTNEQVSNLVTDIEQGEKALRMASQGFAKMSQSTLSLATDLRMKLHDGEF